MLDHWESTQNNPVKRVNHQIWADFEMICSNYSFFLVAGRVCPPETSKVYGLLFGCHVEFQVVYPVEVELCLVQFLWHSVGRFKLPHQVIHQTKSGPKEVVPRDSLNREINHRY